MTSQVHNGLIQVFLHHTAYNVMMIYQHKYNVCVCLSFHSVYSSVIWKFTPHKHHFILPNCTVACFASVNFILSLISFAIDGQTHSNISCKVIWRFFSRGHGGVDADKSLFGYFTTSTHLLKIMNKMTHEFNVGHFALNQCQENTVLTMFWNVIQTL